MKLGIFAGRSAAVVAVVTGVVLALGVASAEAAITTSHVTTPADGTLLFQNVDTNPNQTFTVSGTTNGGTGDSVDIACYQGGKQVTHNGAFPVQADGSFSASVPQSVFEGESCELLAVPTTLPSPPTGFTGPRVGFSFFQTEKLSSGANSGDAYDFSFVDAPLTGSSFNDSIDDCGPGTFLTDGSAAMNAGPYLFDCAGSFYNSPKDFFATNGLDLDRADIQVDGQNAYGSASVNNVDNGIPGFPALTATLDSFDPATGNAQTTERESLVKCTPNDVWNPNSTDCTAYGSTGVAIKRVTSFTDGGRVQTVTDTYSSTDGAAHALDLEYETDLNAPTAGWELPGESAFSHHSTGETGPAPSTAPGTVYTIDDTSQAPSLTNPVGAMTFATPYSSVRFDNTLWSLYDSGEESALFDYQRTVPAGGSVTITWSYATGATVAEVQGDATAARDAMQAPSVAISSPAGGSTVTSSPVTVTGSASAGSGVKSVTVNGIAATLSGGTWRASVALTRGQNTITATATSDAGNTAKASETVTYTPPVVVTPPVPVAPHISLKSKRFTGKAVLVRLACAAGGTSCKGKVTLRHTETVVNFKHGKTQRHKVTLVLGSAKYSISAGQSDTIKVTLTRTAKRLLKRRHKLGTKDTVTLVQLDRHTTTAIRFKLTLRQSTKKHHT